MRISIFRRRKNLTPDIGCICVGNPCKTKKKYNKNRVFHSPPIGFFPLFLEIKKKPLVVKNEGIFHFCSQVLTATAGSWVFTHVHPLSTLANLKVYVPLNSHVDLLFTFEHFTNSLKHHGYYLMYG